MPTWQATRGANSTMQTSEIMSTVCVVAIHISVVPYILEHS